MPENAEHKGGLAVFGDRMGAYPIDPTVIVHTEDALPETLGTDPGAAVTIDTAASRRFPVLAAGDSQRETPATWSYTTDEPGQGWAQPKFSTDGWKQGQAGFGTPGTPAVAVHTRWDTPRIWLRTTVDLPEIGHDDALTLHLFHDEDVEVRVNGKVLYRTRGYLTSYQDITLNDAQKELFHPGENTIAVSCRQTGGGQGVDVGLLLLKAE